jgi:hypothetical protein
MSGLLKHNSHGAYHSYDITCGLSMTSECLVGIHVPVVGRRVFGSPSGTLRNAPEGPVIVDRSFMAENEDSQVVDSPVSEERLNYSDRHNLSPGSIGKLAVCNHPAQSVQH